MQSAIPLSVDFSIKPSVLGVPGNGVDTNGLILTDNVLMPVGDPMYFFDKQSVADFFGDDSKEYTAANIYFPGAIGSYATPSKLSFSRFVTDADGASAYVRSGKISERFETFKATIPAGSTIILTLDGQQITATIDITASTSFIDVATVIQTAINTPPAPPPSSNDIKADPAQAVVNWEAKLKCFFIASEKKGTDSECTITDGTAIEALKLTNQTGLITSNGAAASDPSAALDEITSKHQDWVAFSTTFDCDNDLSLKFAQWASGQNYRYAYSMHDTDKTIINSNESKSCNMAAIIEEDLGNVIATYGDFTQAVAPLAYFASINFSQDNGRAPLKFREFTGISVTVDNRTAYNNALSNGYNFYGYYALNNTKSTYYADGHITGQFLWANTWVYSVYINAQLVENFNTLFKFYASEPFNEIGYTAVRSCVQSVCESVKAFGAIRSGVTLDPTQIQEIKQQTGGLDITEELFNKGWYFFIPPQNAKNRGARILDGCILFYCDGGDIQKINMTSEVII